MLCIEVIHDLFHVSAGLHGLISVIFGCEGQQTVLCGSNLVHLEVDVGKLLELVAVAGERSKNVVPLLIDLGRDLVNGGRLVDIDGAQAQLARAVDADALGDGGSRRRGHVDRRDTQLLQRDRENGRGGGGAHIAERDYRGDGLFFGEHCGIFAELCSVLAADSLGVFHPLAVVAAYLAQMLLNAVKNGVVIAEAELGVIVEKDLSALKFFKRRTLGQLEHRALLIAARIQHGVDFGHCFSPLPEY